MSSDLPELKDRMRMIRQPDRSSSHSLMTSLTMLTSLSDKFSGPRKVLVSLDFLRSLIGLVAGELAFDVNFYQERYADLRNGVE